MAKQTPYQDNRFPHHTTYAPGPSAKKYEGPSALSSSSTSDTNHNTSSSSSPPGARQIGPANSAQYLGHPNYPMAATDSFSQWFSTIPPPTPMSGQTAYSRLGVQHPGVVSSHRDTQGAVIAVPPSQTSTFKLKASRHDAANPPEAEVILEEKRQRNTAASARFRVRKKERSQQLEQTVSELSSRAEELEREASDLRRENTWLKEIVIMKGRQNFGATSAPSGALTRRGESTSSSAAGTSSKKASEKPDSEVDDDRGDSDSE